MNSSSFFTQPMGFIGNNAAKTPTIEEILAALEEAKKINAELDANAAKIDAEIVKIFGSALRWERRQGYLLVRTSPMPTIITDSGAYQIDTSRFNLSKITPESFASGDAAFSGGDK